MSGEENTDETTWLGLRVVAMVPYPSSSQESAAEQVESSTATDDNQELQLSPSVSDPPSSSSESETQSSTEEADGNPAYLEPEQQQQSTPDVVPASPVSSTSSEDDPFTPQPPPPPLDKALQLDCVDLEREEPPSLRVVGMTTTVPIDTKKVFSPWTRVTEGFIHKGMRKAVVALGSSAARHPKTWIATLTFIGFAMAIVGFLTNFRTEFEQRAFLTPQGSLPDVHSDWIKEESGFETLRFFWMALHSDGNNVVTAKAMKRAFITMDAVLTTPGFHQVCSQSQYLDFRTNKPTCRIFSPTQFWDHKLARFENQLTYIPEEDEDEYVREYISNTQYPDGTPVFHEAILGNYEYKTVSTQDEETGELVQTQVVTGAQSFVFKIDIPDLGAITDKYEKKLLDRLLVLKEMWLEEDKKLEADSADSGDGDGSYPPVVRLEFFTLNAYQNEFQRAMDQDLPLVVVLIAVMVSFTCVVFYRRKEKVQSRGLLGLFSFGTIGMSLITGYGLMFLIGVPLTSAGIMIPFVVVGVGLDDTFIITGAYFRRRREAEEEAMHSTEERDPEAETIRIIEETLDEVGVSICMTTVTTLLCFLVGSVSTIPVVRWLCFYAASTIGVDFFFQITYFISWLTMDERRVQANRKDFCFWIVVQDEEEDAEYRLDSDDNEANVVSQCKIIDTGTKKEESELGYETSLELAESERTNGSPPVTNPPDKDMDEIDLKEENDSNKYGKIEEQTSTAESTQPSSPLQDKTPTKHKQLDRNFMERFMSWYADQLMKPYVKVFVIVVFAAYFAGCVYSTTLLYQEFNVGDYVPKDSFLSSFMTSFSAYTSIQRFIGVYFRNVDQSDPYIQEQMLHYVDELAALPEIGEPPAFFWLRDFPQLAESEQAQEYAEEYGVDISDFSFNEQVDLALKIPEVRQVYAQDIVRDPVSGNITASRTFLFLRKIDFQNVTNQVEMLNIQRDLTLAQPVNQGKEEMSFFTIDDMYFFWELYDITVEELIFTTVSCVVIVSVVSFVLIPHWSAVLFVTPLIIMLYFDLLGTMQYCGIKVNSITYFIIVMAIGLLVDFLMHMLLRYYETTGTTRHAKVKEMLETMGASILLGGFTTWLGTIPLAFSTTKVFMTVFISFLAMVTLGCAVGLALLPVLLSLIGPVDSVMTFVPATPQTMPMPSSPKTESETSSPVNAKSNESSPTTAFLNDDDQQVARGATSLLNGEYSESSENNNGEELSVVVALSDHSQAKIKRRCEDGQEVVVEEAD